MGQAGGACPCGTGLSVTVSWFPFAVVLTGVSSVPAVK